jgi:hypothetical protein
MSGGLDPSIALGFKPTAPAGNTNPFNQFSQTVDMANSINRFRREDETFNAQQTIGRALQNSMDPQTGQINQEAFKAEIANNPMAGFLAPQALAQAKALEQGNLQVQQTQALLGMARLNNMRQSVQGLLANPNVTRQDVVAAVGELLALPENERPFSATVAAATLANLPTNPAGVRQWLLQQMASTDQGLQQIQRFLPNPTGVQTGAATRFVDTNPLTNPNAAGQSVTNEPGPDARNNLVQRYNPNTRQMEFVPRQEIGPMVGGEGAPATGTAPGQGTPPGTGAPRPPMPAQQPGGRPGMGDGRYPGSPRPGQVPGASSPPTERPTPSAAPAGPPLGAAGASEVVAQRSAEQSVELSRQADQVPTMMATLGNMKTMLTQFNTGPGAAWTREMVNAYNRIAPPTMQIRVEGTAAQEEFVKLSTQLAQQQFQALGGTGANEQLASAMRTSPNETLSKMGNQSIIALLQGNADAIRVKSDEWQKWLSSGRGPETYNQFSNEFNKGFDPRIFQAIHMSAESRRQMMNTMSQNEREDFNRNFRTAVDKGWVRVPGTGAQGGSR